MKSIKKKTVSALRWTEKYTKTDMIYLAKGGSWLTFGQAVSSLAAFLLAIAFANFLPKETFGTYKFILSIGSILAISTLPGMLTSLTRSVAKGMEGTLTQVLKSRLKWSTLTAASGLAVASYYYINGNETLTISFLIVAALMPLASSLNLHISFLQGKGVFDKVSVQGIVVTVVSVGTMSISILLTNNLFVILLSYFIPLILSRGILLGIVYKNYVKNKKVDREAIVFGKHLTLMNFLGVIAQHIDKVLLFHFLGPVELAIYHFATAIPEQIKAPLKNIGALALPRFSRKAEVTSDFGIMDKTIRLGALALAMVLLYIIFSPLLFRIFLPEYLEALFPSQIFSVSLITIVSLLPMTLLKAMGKTKELYILNTTTHVAQIVLFVVLIYWFGIFGAIVARVLARIINMALSYHLSPSSS